jgi:hypothetical protein
MRKSLPIGGALLALAAFISTADARMMGGGVLGDPPIGPPKASTQPSRDHTSRYHPGYGGSHGHNGYIDQYGHFHPFYGGGSNGSKGPPLACVGRIGGC